MLSNEKYANLSKIFKIIKNVVNNRKMSFILQIVDSGIFTLT